MKLYAVHEKKIKFDQIKDSFLISLHDIEKFKFKQSEHPELFFSVETFLRHHPKTIRQTLASILFVTLEIKQREGTEHFYFVYNQETKEQIFDMINGLIDLFELSPANEEEAYFFRKMKEYEGMWSQFLKFEQESGFLIC